MLHCVSVDSAIPKQKSPTTQVQAELEHSNVYFKTKLKLVSWYFITTKPYVGIKTRFLPENCVISFNSIFKKPDNTTEIHFPGFSGHFKTNALPIRI